MKIILSLCLVAITVLSANMAHAQRGISIIRDTEIENILSEWVEPILEQAGLTSDQVQIALVNSDEVNAFVAGGANIFIYAGLIEKAEYPEEVIGVIAHEVGHINGGHLIVSRRAMERASYQSILATVLGVGAAIATGDGAAATSISVAGSSMAQRGFFGHSRAQESAADQAGLKYVIDANINPRGLLSFLTKLEGEELLPPSQQSEYMRTHPLTRDRIAAVRAVAKTTDNVVVLGETVRQEQFDLIKAKLLAFRNPQNVPRYYDGSSEEIVDLYAHAIMKYQQKNFDEALDIFDKLLEMQPKAPYFWEMKAQILRDAGRLDQAEIVYKQALSLLDKSQPLIETALAHVMIEQQKSDPEIEGLLLSSIQNNKRDGHAYRLMATLKGRMELEAEAQYYLAEEAMLEGRTEDAKRMIDFALNDPSLPPALKIKANDLILYMDRLPERDK